MGGQIYAMSALFGYSLRNFDKRYQMEKMLGSFGSWGDEEASSGKRSGEQDLGSLKEYIASFGPSVLQNMMSVSSVEARKSMSLQVVALFGDLESLKKKVIKAVGS